MRPGLIAIDMDGTLLNAEGRVSTRNRAALQAAEDAGVEVVIATGRRHAYAMRVLRELQLNPAATVVSSNGTVLRTIDSRLLHRSHMSLTTARWLCTHIEEFRPMLMLTFDTVGADGDDQPGALVCERLDHLESSIGRWIESNRPYIRNVARLEEALEAEPPIQMMLCGPVARMADAEARLLEHPRIVAVGADDEAGAEIALHRTIYPEKDLCIVDILPAGRSKASALLHLAELRGLSCDQIMAIGDNWNDLPMLRLAGHAVLMGNAPQELKDMAQQSGWTLAPSHVEDGVAVAIEAVLAGELAATRS